MNLVPLNKIFEVNYGSKFDLKKMSVNKNSNIAFVGRSAKNNGVTAFIDEVEKTPFSAGTITVNLGGAVLESYVQLFPFYTAQNVAVLKPKREMSEIEKLYYCYVIKANKFRYGAFGREANRTLRTLLVPENVPQKFLNIKIDKISNRSILDKKNSFSDRKWKWFEYKGIFNVGIGKSVDLNKLEKIENGMNYVGRTEENNGITAKVINNKNFVVYQGDCITLPMVGHSTLKSSYQTEPFCVSQNIAILRPNNFSLNVYVATFLNTIIRKDIFRFAYGRTLSLERLKMLKIKLPVDQNGKPDWQFMEDYIKSLPYSASI